MFGLFPLSISVGCGVGGCAVIGGGLVLVVE